MSYMRLGGLNLMEYVREIQINEVVIHVLDNKTEEPILNEYRLDLNEEIYRFVYKHIERCLNDEELKYAVFNEGISIVKDISQEYLNGKSSILEASKEIARQLFALMKSRGNIISGDLLIASISTEYGHMMAILKLDYIKNYTHKIDLIEDKLSVNIIPYDSGLPKTKRVNQCAFIKPIREGQSFNIMILDKKKTNEEYGVDYFTENLIGCTIVDNERDMTRKLIAATERFVRSSIQGDSLTAEKIRTAVKEELKQSDKVNIDKLSENIFGEGFAKEVFTASIKELVGCSELDLDKKYIDKKLKKVKLKIDNDIEIIINEEAYKDKSRFEIISNENGTINFVVKNVLDYIEK